MHFPINFLVSISLYLSLAASIPNNFPSPYGSVSCTTLPGICTMIYSTSYFTVETAVPTVIYDTPMITNTSHAYGTTITAVEVETPVTITSQTCYETSYPVTSWITTKIETEVEIVQTKTLTEMTTLTTSGCQTTLVPGSVTSSTEWKTICSTDSTLIGSESCGPATATGMPYP